MTDQATRDWLAGYACALATIMRAHDEGVAVRDAMGCVGGYDALVKAGADEYDLEALEPLR